MRILKGYSKDEQKELEEAKDKNFDNAFDLICGIGDANGECHALSQKYYHEGTNEEDNKLAKDIVDFYYGNAKFPEQKYYVQLIKNSEVGYLNRNKSNTFLILEGCHLSQNYQNKFTEQEIKDIDPRYMAFAVPVEDDDE